jgi:hypothetical protein
MKKEKKFHFDLDEYHNTLLQEAYERGEFEPRGKRKELSGLVITFLVPPVYHYSFDP